MRPALVSIVAVVASFLLTYGVCALVRAGASPAVLSAFLAMTLARHAKSPQAAAISAIAMRLASLVLVAIAATAIGFVLRHFPVAGAMLYSLAMFVSVWLRRFGERAASIGATIALPLIAILAVPVRIESAGGPVVDLLLVALASLIALFCTTFIYALTRRGRFMKTAATQPKVRARSTRNDAALPASTRMAFQMLAAMLLAFSIGMPFFHAHWPWIVLTAFIVCSGARGRGEALYKGLLRLGGALAGAIAATGLAYLPHLDGRTTAIAIFAILFLGIWLREVNYAFWAACATLIFALLQTPASGPIAHELGARLECILIGAILGVVASWFVFPIRTEAVVRRRLADALAALGEVFSHARGADDEYASRLARFDHLANSLADVEAPVKFHRAVLGGAVAEHPAVWIATARELFCDAHTALASNAPIDPTAVVRAVGAARRAIAAHHKPVSSKTGDEITPALRRVARTLQP